MLPIINVNISRSVSLRNMQRETMKRKIERFSTFGTVIERNDGVCLRPHVRSENILKKCSYELYTIIN